MTNWKRNTPYIIDTPYGKQWMMNGRKHRAYHPAYVAYVPACKLTIKEWWDNGQKHRLDAPAVEHSDGRKEWWVRGELIHVERSPAEIKRARFRRHRDFVNKACKLDYELGFQGWEVYDYMRKFGR